VIAYENLTITEEFPNYRERHRPKVMNDDFDSHSQENGVITCLQPLTRIGGRREIEQRVVFISGKISNPLCDFVRPAPGIFESARHTI
jgi:hypothetical protein